MKQREVSRQEMWDSISGEMKSFFQVMREHFPNSKAEYVQNKEKVWRNGKN